MRWTALIISSGNHHPSIGENSNKSTRQTLFRNDNIKKSIPDICLSVEAFLIRANYAANAVFVWNRIKTDMKKWKNKQTLNVLDVHLFCVWVDVLMVFPLHSQWDCSNVSHIWI